MKTSAQVKAPGTACASNPLWLPACHTPNGAPPGSAAITIVPKSPTCIGSTITWPPCSRTFPAVAAASGEARYRHQADGASWPGMGGDSAATALPSTYAWV